MAKTDIQGRRGELYGRAVAMDAPRSISTEQRRALRSLAGSPLGCTEAILLAHGFRTELLALLVRDGLATTQRGTMCAGRRKIEVVWVMITDAGQRALAG